MSQEELNLQDWKIREEGMVAILTLDRPNDANAIRAQTTGELDKLLDLCESRRDIRAIVITGGGEKIFCAGADLKAGFGGGADASALIEKGQNTLTRLERMGKPVVCALNGHATGGGCEIALACHFRFMKKGAKMGLTESNLGLIPGYGGTQRLARLLPRPLALKLMLLGTLLIAEQWVELGVVQEVFDSPDEVREAAIRFAAELAERPPLAVKGIIDSVYGGVDETMNEGLKRERENFLPLVSSKDVAEGIGAFFMKRKPNFKGE